MKIRYLDLINQSFDFPTDEFSVNTDGNMFFHRLNLMDLVKEYGTPLKIHYLPKISENIQKAKQWFLNSMKNEDYQGKYHYCYCTKSSHFKFILLEGLKNDIHLETSSAYDLKIVEKLFNEGLITKDQYIICNGYKTEEYLLNIIDLINKGFNNLYPIIDNYKELDQLAPHIQTNFSIGIRIASEEEPKFEFYTSRLGIGYKNIVNYYKDHIKNYKNVNLKMLHFFINTGISDTAYYWNELTKCLRVYAQLKQLCPSLDSLNIGGGFPIKRSLSFDYDYAYMIDEIIYQIKQTCLEYNIPHPDIFTEFGSYTVGESGATLFKILYQKQQNDREKWNMIDGSFMTSLPDSWAVSQRFIMFPLNHWHNTYERVLLGGLTCDSDDYYNSEQHVNAIYLPKYNQENSLYIGFFNTGAYQESIGGFGGLQHCLIPNPKHLVITKNDDGSLNYNLFKDKQDSESMLKLLGYE